MEDNTMYTYLKEIELNALLCAAGVERWYGPGSDSTDTLKDREDLHRIMAELYRKGVLDWEDKTALITDPAGSIVRTIRDSAVCILTGTRDNESGLSYVYVAGDTAAQIMTSDNDEDMLKAAVMTFDGWLDRLEEGFFPELIGDAPEMPDTEPGEVYSVMEVRDMRSGELKGQLHAEDRGTYGMLYLSAGGRQDAFLCVRDEYEKIIRDWTEAGE